MSLLNKIQSIGRILRPAPEVPITAPKITYKDVGDAFDWNGYSYWSRIDGVWYHRTGLIPGNQYLKADIIITKDEHSVFKYVKHRSHGDLRPLNEEELKDMIWIILSAEKA